MAVMLIVLVGMGTYAFAAPNISGGIGDIMGQGQFPSDPGKIFRLVRYVPAAGDANSWTLTKDSIVIFDTNSDDGVTVTTTTTSYDSRVAGVLAIDALTPDAQTNGWSAAASVGRRNWTWLQTYGIAEVYVQNDCATATAGDALATGSDLGRTCDFLASTDSAVANGNAGFYYDTGAANADDVECFIRLD